MGGRGAGIVHKAHALIHSTRLACHSWQSACKLRSCVSFAGDLGTESSIVHCKMDFRALLGNWMVDEDAIGRGLPPADAPEDAQEAQLVAHSQGVDEDERDHRDRAQEKVWMPEGGELDASEEPEFVDLRVVPAPDNPAVRGRDGGGAAAE